MMFSYIAIGIMILMVICFFVSEAITKHKAKQTQMRNTALLFAGMLLCHLAVLVDLARADPRFQARMDELTHKSE